MLFPDHFWLLVAELILKRPKPIFSGHKLNTCANGSFVRSIVITLWFNPSFKSGTRIGALLCHSTAKYPQDWLTAPLRVEALHRRRYHPPEASSCPPLRLRQRRKGGIERQLRRRLFLGASSVVPTDQERMELNDLLAPRICRH